MPPCNQAGAKTQLQILSPEGTLEYALQLPTAENYIVIRSPKQIHDGFLQKIIALRRKHKFIDDYQKLQM